VAMQIMAGVRRLPRRYKVFWRWGFLVGYTAGIFLLSAIPGHALPTVRVSDKLIHAVEFGLLAVLLCRALRVSVTTWSHSRIIFVSALIAIFYGATDEFHQLFVPQRSAELVDLAADSLGATLAVWGWFKAGTRWTWLQ